MLVGSTSSALLGYKKHLVFQALFDRDQIGDMGSDQMLLYICLPFFFHGILCRRSGTVTFQTPPPLKEKKTEKGPMVFDLLGTITVEVFLAYTLS